MRGTYKASHKLCKTGKQHPQSPPLHLHFDQSETFEVLTGTLGTTSGWDAKDQTWTAASGKQELRPWIPHTFWPCPNATEDTTFLVWAHPQHVEEPMDWMFFRNLLLLVSDIYEKKVAMDVLQIMLTQ